jgi:type VII secretion protein EccB
MTSRRDQVQAYGFVVGRLNSALVHGEPDAVHPPMQRTRSATLGGVALGGLGVAGFLLWGLISPVHKAVAAPTAGDLIVVPQTGASYLYDGAKLFPVLNWSSARMLIGGSPQVENETAAAIAGIPQGPSLGIVGAPDSLPTEVNRGDWLACAVGSGGSPKTALAIGVSPPPAAPVPSGQALVVAAGGSGYLIWHGHRLRLAAPWMTSALGLGQAPVTQVSQTWLNAVPAGPDLLAFSLRHAGDRGPTLDGQTTQVGQVLTTHNVGGRDAFFLVESDGVAAITATQAALELASPGTAAAYPGGTAQPVTVSAPAIASAPRGTQLLPDGTGDPASPPSAAAPPKETDVPCLAYPGAGGVTPELLWTAPPGGSAPDLQAPGVTGAATDADLVGVASGGGALVQPLTATGAAVAGGVYLVTSAGVKFAVPTSTTLAANELTALGYQASQVVRLPATLLGLLPTGPSLNLAPLR